MLNCGCSSGGSTGQLRLVIQSLAALVCRSGILTPVCLTESSAGEWGMHNSIVSELVHTPAQAPDVFVLIPVLPHTLIIFRCNSLFLHPVQRGAAGSTGPASVSWHATSDGDVAWWNAAYPADWPPVRKSTMCHMTTASSSSVSYISFSTSLLIWMWWQVFFGLNQQFITSVFYTAVLLLCLVLQVHKWGTKQHLHVYNSTV